MARLNQQAMSNPSEAKCPRCAAPLPPSAPEGLCPRCLGALNLATDTVLTSTDAVAAQPPLTPAELAPHFPQLEIIECLGRGGMGVVYRVRQKALNRLAALKLLAPERVTVAGFAERFTREAQALARLNHPNIVTIYDFGASTPHQTPSPIVHPPFYFLLMEFMDGVNLRQAMRAGRFTPEQALAIIPPVCEALQYAHEHGVIHRDIKPENLLLDKAGRIKIADFGIAKMLGNSASGGEASSLVTTGAEGRGEGAGTSEPPPAANLSAASVAGTPQYMAPEQKAHRSTDHRADIYSLGVVLYELLTGELPAQKIQPPSRKVQIDVRLDEIVLRALEQKPELRFQTAGEFRTQVEIFGREGSAKKIVDGAERMEQSQPPPLSSILNPLSSPPPPPFLKVTTSTLLTPAELATFQGQFFAHQTRGQLILDSQQLTHTRAGHTTVIPLAAIRDVSLGQYPRSMNPVGLSLVSVTYEEGGARRQVLLSPMEGWFAFPSTWDALAADWHAAIRAAVKSATGREPSSIPRDQLGIPGGFPWLQLAVVGVPLVAGLGLFFISLGLTGKPPRSVLPVVLITLALTLGFIVPTLFIPWVMRRRAATPPSGPGTGSHLARLGLALLCVPLMIQLLMLLLTLAARLTGTNPAPSGPQFFLGFPETIILAVLGMLGLRAQRRREPPPVPPAAPRTYGHNLLGIGLICFGMFLGGLKINEAQRDHFQRVQNLAWEIPRLQTQWHAAQQAVFEARSELQRFEVRAPAPVTDVERQRHVLEHERLKGEVSKAGVRGDVINGQIRTIQDTNEAQRFPTLTDFQFVAARSLPFVLAGLVVLFWRRNPGAGGPGSAVFAAATAWFYACVAAGIALIHVLPWRFNRDSAYFVLVLAALAVSALLGVLVARRTASRGWLRALALAAFVCSLPILGFAAFFAYAWASESGGWSPAPSEALLVPLTFLGAVLLPWAGTRLWRASVPRNPDSPQPPPVPPHAAPREHPATWVLLGMFLLTLLAGALFFKAARPDLFAPSPLVAITNVQHGVMGESNTVFFAELDLRVDGSEAVEFLVEFTGPALSSDAAERVRRESANHGRLFTSLATGANNALLLTPGNVGPVASRVFAPGSHKWQVGFAFPTATLAREARGGFVAPVSTFTPPPRDNPRPGMVKIFGLFTIVGPNHETYHGRIVANRSVPVSPPLTASNPEWVSVSTQSQHNETYVKLTWEILASQPGTAQFYREGNSSTASLQRDSKSKLHRTTASIELTRLSTNSYRLVSKKGYATITENFTGNFRELADELIRSKNLSAKTVRGTPIELCRVRGQPFIVTVVPAAPGPQPAGSVNSGSPATKSFNYRVVALIALIAVGAVVIGFGGVALLVWLLRKGGASTRVVLLVLVVPLLLGAIAVAVLVGMYGLRRDFGPGVSLARLEKAGQMVLDSNYPTPAQPHPPGRVQQTQNGFRLQLPPAQLASFEFFIRQADDSWQAVPSLTALIATGTNASYHDTLYWTLRRSGEPETTDQLWFWTVSANTGAGRPIAQLTDHGTNFTHKLAFGESLDWWQLATPAQTVLKPGEQQLIPLFRTHGTATARGGHPKEAILRARCEPLPAGLNVASNQQLVEAGLAAHALLEKVLSASNAATAIPPHIEFKVLRVENPPGTRNILLHFERDSNYGLAIEVWQDVTRLQGRPGPAPDQRDWRQREWVGVNSPRVLRWVLPQEFSPDEAKALAKEMEKKWKGSHPLPDGAVPEFAAALHRDGWKYHLVARVLREPGSPRPAAPAGAMLTAEQRFLVPGNALVGVRLDQSSQDGPKTELGERLLFKTAANRATGFILRWHAYPAQQGKFGNRWILDWVDPDTGVIFHRTQNSFIKPVKLTSPAVPPLPLVSAATQLTEPATSVPFRLLRAEESTVRGVAPTAWWDVFAEVELVRPGPDAPKPAFQLPL